jgi:hypothetical protein
MFKQFPAWLYHRKVKPVFSLLSHFYYRYSIQSPKQFETIFSILDQTCGMVQVRSFLRGPVPMHRLYAAGSLPGKALHVGIVL